MHQYSKATKMPELFVFVKALLVGLVLGELWQIASITTGNLAIYLGHVDLRIRLACAVVGITIACFYAINRGFIGATKRIIRSKRFDLLFTLALGIWAACIFSTTLTKFHESLDKITPMWMLLFVSFVLIMMISSLVRAVVAVRKKPAYQPMYFLTDDEIDDDCDDALSNKEDACKFAETILASGSNSSLVYGIDGPWGIGKTSFVNLACKYWRTHAANEVIVFRFEPLRYGTDPDIADKLIRDLSNEIQSQVFVPEFRPATNRYNRMLKGKAEFSFLGFSLSLEPSTDPIDELLDDINEVLNRIDRRIIVIVDDLDRLDAKAVNDILFTVRRTFRLKQAAFILCYDTENLVSSKDEADRARQFLEKFVNIKLSLFVDSSTLRNFLRTDWNKDREKFPTIPAETMLKLASILGELEEILGGDLAANYMPLIGDLRKLKRFVNAVLLMQIEKTNLARTDFNRKDLINLMLLHLNYPGIFRRVYVEETEGRSGIFSVTSVRKEHNRSFENTKGFAEFVKSYSGTERFLLEQLFCVESLGLNDFGASIDESVTASRACFNGSRNRNLESYLKLIVRFATPEPRSTFKLYQESVADVEKGKPVEDVLSGPDFDLKHGNFSHDEFWRILLSKSYNFGSAQADDSINALVKFLPKYSMVDIDDRGIRTRSIYNLICLLDRSGWKGTNGNGLNNTPQNIVEIAYRIYGEQKYQGNGLIDRLAEDHRGVLGLYDLVLFRLQCCADRLGQVYNLHGSLIVYQDMSAPTSGSVTGLALFGMRTLSQKVFALFKIRYIDRKRNFFDEVDALSDDALLGDSASFYSTEATEKGSEEKFRRSINATRSMIKSFIIFQLANRQAGTGSGVGCGYYDSTGNDDAGEISSLMINYVFDVVFNPEINENNVHHFLDYCLYKMTSGIWEGRDDAEYAPSAQGLTEIVGRQKLALYWIKHGADIKSQKLETSERGVTTWNYAITYKEFLPRVFEVLDQIQSDYSKLEVK